jgi:hypothetical protein
MDQKDDMIQNLKKHRLLYFSLGFTLIMVLYLRLFLSDFSECFNIELSINSLGLTFYYTKDMVQGFFKSRNIEQLICYREFLLIWDPIFAIIYTLMYSSWISLLFKNKFKLLVIPASVMITDCVENYIELKMLDNFIDLDIIDPIYVLSGSGFNIIKWLLFSMTYFLILIGIIKVIKSYILKS